ncbi:MULTISPECIES: ABC transporter permease subunit [Clostridium]|uniref:ABC transporter permease subunit n=1 Tax=Clostridium cibarium TaxID=2762247 RepID=A0ABR8PPX6_9CLOT|nr:MULTISPECIES: ABC transporter permease subunit [Clostridium]MBD7910180.1 ABC transporter permease subunit [Clostridium cibarium]
MKEFTWKNKIQGIIACIVLIILWEIIAIKMNNEIYLPRVENVLFSIKEILVKDDFFKNILFSLSRTLISFLIALILAIVFGVLSLMYPVFKSFLKPLNSIGKTIPTMVLIVLALIWFKKEEAPFIVSFFIVFPILYEGVISSINNINKELMDMCKVYKISTWQKVKKIYMPVIGFYITGILMSTFSLAFKVIIAGEVYGEPKYGVGSSIQVEKMNFNTNAIFAWVIIIAILSVSFDLLNKLVIKKVYRWKHEDRN